MGIGLTQSSKDLYDIPYKEELQEFYKAMGQNIVGLTDIENVTVEKIVTANDITNFSTLFTTSSLNKTKMVATFEKIEDIDDLNKAISILEFRYPDDETKVIISVK